MAEYLQKEVEFFGKITAGSTHEMRNVLAIIRESSGLAQDLLALCPDAPLPHRDKFEKALSVIQKQVQRGSELSTHLNKFAHSTDNPEDRVDLYSAATHVAYLSQRFARLRNVALIVDPQPPLDLPVVVRHSRLLLALFACVDCCLEGLPPGSEMHVGARKTDNGVSAYVTRKSGGGANPPALEELLTAGRWGNLNELAGTLGGSLEWDASGSCVRLNLPEVA